MKKNLRLLSLIIIVALTVAMVVVSVTACAGFATPSGVRLQGEALTWNEVPYAIGFQVRITPLVNGVAGEPWIEDVPGYRNTIFNFGGSQGREYRLEVRAVREGAGELPWPVTDNAEFFTAWSTPVVMSRSQRLGMPEILGYARATYQLTWVGVEGATGYEINHNGTIIAVPAGATSFSMEGRITEAPFHHVLRMRALGDGENTRNSEWSRGLSVVITGEMHWPGFEPNAEEPGEAGRRGNLRLSGITIISLNWDAVPNANHYIITATRPAPAGGDAIVLTDRTTATNRALTHLNITEPGEYSIVVTAYSDDFRYPVPITSDAVLLNVLPTIERGDFILQQYLTFTGNVATSNTARLLINNVNNNPLFANVNELQLVFADPGTTQQVFPHILTRTNGNFPTEVNLIPERGANGEYQTPDTGSLVALLNNAELGRAGRVFDIFIRPRGGGAATDGRTANMDGALTLAVTAGEHSSGDRDELDERNHGFLTYTVPRFEATFEIFEYGGFIRTVNNVWVIENAGHLAFAHYYSHLNFVLTANISLRDQEFFPIGYYGRPFTGNFYGNNHSIYGFRITRFFARGELGFEVEDANGDIQEFDVNSIDQQRYSLLGFFGHIGAGANVSNLAVLWGIIESPINRITAGVFAGRIEGVVSMSDVSGRVRASGADYAGGFAGEILGGKVEFSTALILETITSGRVAGGFAGRIEGVQTLPGVYPPAVIIGASVYFSTVNASVAIADRRLFTERAVAGGFAGIIINANVQSSFARGTSVVAGIPTGRPGNVFSGGFAGIMRDVNIEQSYSDITTSITARRGQAVAIGTSFAGGFAGAIIDSNVHSTYALGSITGDVASGGFAGNIADSTVAHSFANVRVPTGTHNGLFAATVDNSTINNAFFNEVRSRDRFGVAFNGGLHIRSLTNSPAADTTAWMNADEMGQADVGANFERADRIAQLTGSHLNNRAPTFPLLRNLLYIDDSAFISRSLNFGTVPAAPAGPTQIDNFFGTAFHVGGVGSPFPSGRISIHDFGRLTGVGGEFVTRTPGLRFTIEYMLFTTNADGSISVAQRITRFMTVT